jgi:hypothetical protein
MAQPSCLQARRGSRLDDAAVVGANLVEYARKTPRHRDVEGSASVAVVLDEAPAGWAIVDHREASKQLLAVGTAPHSVLVRLEQVNRARPMMAAPPAGNAISTARIGRIRQRGRRTGHRVRGHAHYSRSGQLAWARAGAIRASSARTADAVGRFDGSCRSVEKRSSVRAPSSVRLLSARMGGG